MVTKTEESDLDRQNWREPAVKWSSDSRFLLVVGFLVALGAVRLLLAAALDLIPDEAYYWTWSRNLSFCYYDQPGMVAFVGHLATWLTGTTTGFAARLPFVLLSLGGSVLIYAFSQELFCNRWRALAAVLVLNVTPLFWGGSFLIMHDSPLLFFWIAAAYLLARLQKTGKRVYFYLAVLALVGAMYSKFTGVLLAASTVMFFACSPKQRRWLATADFYVGAILAAILFLPVLIWNRDHDWIAARAVLHLGEGSPASLITHLKEFLSYQGGSWLIMSPLIYPALIAGLWMGCQRWLADRDDDATLLCISLSLPILVFFSLMTLHSRVHPNWSAMAYPAAIVLMVEELGRRARPAGAKGVLLFSRRSWLAAICVSLLISLLASVQALWHIIPMPDKMARKDRIYKEFYGWKNLGAAAGHEVHPGEQILAFRYQVAAELEFYVPGQPRIYCMNAFGRGNQYDFTNDYAALSGRDVLVVTTDPFPGELAEKFASVGQPKRYEILHRGTVIKEFFFYHCRGFDPNRGGDLSGRKHV